MPLWGVSHLKSSVDKRCKAMRCAIVGAGLSGLTCADTLQSAGHDVVIFDKGRGPGGRMSARRWQTRFGEGMVDYGAPCLHVRSPEFRAVVAAWNAQGLVAPWPPGGPDAWTGIPGMNAVVTHLATSHRVLWQTFVSGLLRDANRQWFISSDRGQQGPFDVVVTAIPAEQTVPILALQNLDMAKVAAQTSSHACWTGLFAFGEDLPAPQVLHQPNSVIASAFCNRAKPGRDGPEIWVVHADPAWSARNLERTPAEIATLLLPALADALGVKVLPPHESKAHRWRFAYADGFDRSPIWNANLRLGACGDWVFGRDAECAWLSGRALAKEIDESVPVARPVTSSSGVGKTPRRSSSRVGYGVA